MATNLGEGTYEFRMVDLERNGFLQAFLAQDMINWLSINK